MKFGDLLDELIKLQLLAGEYVVFGSGPMAVRGMREARDMDILATKSFWGVLAEKYPSYKKGKTIEIGNIEIWKDWPSFPDPEEVIRGAEMIRGFPFALLSHVLSWKRSIGREKDAQDIQLIEQYLLKQ